MQKVKAVIFDFDGTMLDSERLNAIVFDKVMIELGYKIPDAYNWYFENAVGSRVDKIMLRMQEDFGIEPNPSFIELYRNYRTEFYKTNPPQAKKGLIELLDFIKSKNLKIAICSSSRLDQIKLKMEKAGVSLDYFDVIVDGTAVRESKPHPEPYQAACRILGVNPKNAIVLEDSSHGIISAHAAGIPVILVPDVKVDPKTQKLAWHTVESLDLVIPLLKNYFE